jgi:hypothetical protein
MKAYLRITHSADDVLLQDLIDGAEDEALRYLDRESLPRRNEAADTEADSNTPDPASDADDLAPVVRIGIYLIVQSMYEGKDSSEVAACRAAAETKWSAYRGRLGA